LAVILAKQENSSYLIGILCSLVLHLLGVVIVIVVLETSVATAIRPVEVFTVTLEGGKKLGAIAQVPTESKKESKTTKATTKQSENTIKPEVKKEIVQPTVVDKLKEKKELEEKEKKKKEEAKKAEQEKIKAEEAKKKKEEDEKKKKAEQEKLAKEKEKQERDKRLSNAVRKLADQYNTESYDAGGDGSGAARLGGKGTGGGTLASIEFIAYRNQLEQHIKSGWHWVPGERIFRATVRMQMLPSGFIQNATIDVSSGNSNFDDSAIRAVYKANPVPPPPVELAEQFRDVRINFDSHR
jgi:colicin import membrane protein